MKSILKIYRLGIRWPLATLIVFGILSILAALAAKNLRIENNLSTLLPKDFQSVQALRAMEASFGGLGFLVVTVEGKNPETTREFADQLAGKVEVLPGVQYVDYRRPIEFFKSRQWYYFDLADLEEMEQRLDRSLELQQRGVSPYFHDLMDFADEEDNPDLTFEDIRKKYEDKQGFALESESGERVSSDSGNFIAFRVKTKTHQQNLDAGEVIIAEITGLKDQLIASPQFSDISVSFSGDHVGAIDTVHFLKKRMTMVSIVVLALLIFVLWAYMRRFSAVLLVGIPLLLGILWTGGLIYLFLDHLNIITGFAAGILAGLGSDYGIYIVTRFFQERGAGKDFRESCDLAFQNTGRASYSSMLTTVFAFLALIFSDFGVMVEFGIVGALGLFMNYLAMMVVLPALLSLREKYFSKKDTALGDLHHGLEKSKIFKALFYPRAPGAVISVVLLLCVVSTLILPQQSKMHFDDGRLDPLGTPGEKLYQKVANLYGGTLQPTLLLVQGWEESENVVKAFNNEIENSENPKALPFKNVIGLSSFVPKNIDAKKSILKRLSEKFNKSKFPVENKRLELMESFDESVASSSIGIDDLPVEVRRMFISPFKRGTYAVFLFPQWDDLNWEWMERYSNTVYDVRQKYQLNFQAVDNPFLATEFVELMNREMPKMIVVTLLFLLLMLLWVARPFARALIIFSHLVVGLLLLAGLMWLFKLELNTINFAAFPIILGTGIDCFIHFGLRFDESGNIKDTINDKLPTILVSNLTTIIGFAGLLFIPSAGLRSLGWTSLLGLIIMTALCAFVFPRILCLYHKNDDSAVAFTEEPCEI